MGKNTMMKRSIRLYCEETGNDQWAPLLDELVGNVGLIFTKQDLSQVRTHQHNTMLQGPVHTPTLQAQQQAQQCQEQRTC